MARIACNSANSYTLCESVNMTMKIVINIYDNLTLPRNQKEVRCILLDNILCE